MSWPTWKIAIPRDPDIEQTCPHPPTLPWLFAMGCEAVGKRLGCRREKLRKQPLGLCALPQLQLLCVGFSIWPSTCSNSSLSTKRKKLASWFKSRLVSESGTLNQPSYCPGSLLIQSVHQIPHIWEELA